MSSKKCNACDFTFPSATALQKHQASCEKKYYCQFCGECFMYQHNLHDHIRSDINEKPFECLRCSKSFSTSHILHNHLQSHLGSKRYQCSSNDKTLVNSANLKRHQKIHIPYDTRQHVCLLWLEVL